MSREHRQCVACDKWQDKKICDECERRDDSGKNKCDKTLALPLK